ncbi:hypothetical protein HYT04_02800 [Candidatus Kaiserbacteria bacterium]|nr:hypothetical protein [Candidatus Kaiserbacteria bacterium]
MTIAEVREKCKSLTDKVPKDVLILVILILTSSLSFGLGYLAGLDARVPKDALNAQATSADGRFVASKSGTKYYLPACAGAERISDANKVWFISASAAVAAGYSPAANCAGI